jgi:hypothetical protein
MKHLLPFLFTAVLLAGKLAAQQQLATPDDFTAEKAVPSESANKIKYVLIMPEEKTAEPVKAEERNPFGKTQEDAHAPAKGSREENAIRTRMESMKIVGVAPGAHGLRVMLGNMMLEEGETVPPVIPDQTLSLCVSKITDQSIELKWIEKKAAGLPPSVFTLPIDLRPFVRYQLPGQGKEKAQSEKAKAIAMGTRFLEPKEPISSSALKMANASTGTKSAATREAPELATMNPSETPGATPLAATPQPSAAANNPGATPQDPAEWKRAVGFLNDLVKVEEPKK